MKINSRSFRIWTDVSTAFNRYRIQQAGGSIGDNFETRGRILLSLHSPHGVTIGKNVTVNSAPLADPVGGGESTVFATFGQGEILIGDRVGISNSAICASQMVMIENDVMIGAGCRIWDTDFHAADPDKRLAGERGSSKPVVIMQRAFIGGGSIILKGVIIGENAVIGAGSVVTKSVPDGEIWAGNPAHRIGTVAVEPEGE